MSSLLLFFLLLLSLRFLYILLFDPPILDCDETYNYYEPLHKMLFNYGMQTWEYSDLYKLRTYTFLYPSYSVLRGVIYFLPSVSKSNLFLLNRLFLTFLSTVSEIMLISTLRLFSSNSSSSALSSSSPLSNNFTPSVSLLQILTFIYLSLSPGQFYASFSLLPSSLVLTLTLISTSLHIHQHLKSSIFFGLLATIMTGWPFAAVIYIPLGVHAVYLSFNGIKNNNNNNSVKAIPITTTTTSIMNVIKLLATVLGMTIPLIIITVLVDSYYYNSFMFTHPIPLLPLTFPPLNIFLYNAIPSGGGDELYGVEPWHYYVKNLMLNLNIGGGVFALLLALPTICFEAICLWREKRWGLGNGKEKNDSARVNNNNNNSNSTIPIILSPSLFLIPILAPALLWLLLLFSRPHKEERFLQPIYGHMAVIGAVVTERVLLFGEYCLKEIAAKLSIKMKRSEQQQQQRQHRNTTFSMYRGVVVLSIITLSVLLSASRLFSLPLRYNAPYVMFRDVVGKISSLDKTSDKTDTTATTITATTTVCVANEWYRFPSNFNLGFGERSSKSNVTSQK